jgi:colicin import membrane protein
MRETRVDTTYAIVLALLLHAIPLALLVLAVLWPKDDAASAGEPIQADVVDVNALSASMRSALRRPPEPEPIAEPVQSPPPETLPEALEEVPPQESLPEQQLRPQEQVPDPDEIQQEEVVRNTESDEAAQREQEAKRIQAQRDLTENREAQEEIEQRRRQTEMERQRQQQLADIRRQRAEAARQAALSEERLRQLADRRAQQASAEAATDASGTPPAGNRGTEADPRAAYVNAIADAIRRNWVRPENVLPNQRCRIVIKQLPGGEVIDAQVDPSCPYDELGKRSVEAAVLKAQPLPYAGFERAFQRTLILNFQAEDR